MPVEEKASKLANRVLKEAAKKYIKRSRLLDGDKLPRKGDGVTPAVRFRKEGTILATNTVSYEDIEKELATSIELVIVGVEFDEEIFVNRLVEAYFCHDGFDEGWGKTGDKASKFFGWEGIIFIRKSLTEENIREVVQLSDKRFDQEKASKLANRVLEKAAKKYIKRSRLLDGGKLPRKGDGVTPAVRFRKEGTVLATNTVSYEDIEKELVAYIGLAIMGTEFDEEIFVDRLVEAYFCHDGFDAGWGKVSDKASKLFSWEGVIFIKKGLNRTSVREAIQLSNKQFDQETSMCQLGMQAAAESSQLPTTTTEKQANSQAGEEKQSYLQKISESDERRGKENIKRWFSNLGLRRGRYIHCSDRICADLHLIISEHYQALWKALCQLPKGVVEKGLEEIDGIVRDLGDDENASKIIQRTGNKVFVNLKYEYIAAKPFNKTLFNVLKPYLAAWEKKVEALGKEVEVESTANFRERQRHYSLSQHFSPRRRASIESTGAVKESPISDRMKLFCQHVEDHFEQIRSTASVLMLATIDYKPKGGVEEFLDQVDNIIRYGAHTAPTKYGAGISAFSQTIKIVVSRVSEYFRLSRLARLERLLNHLTLQERAQLIHHAAMAIATRFKDQIDRLEPSSKGLERFANNVVARIVYYITENDSNQFNEQTTWLGEAKRHFLRLARNQYIPKEVTKGKDLAQLFVEGIVQGKAVESDAAAAHACKYDEEQPLRLANGMTTQVRWTSRGIIENTGVRTADGRYFVSRDGSRTNIEIHGYCLGTAAEAKKRGLSECKGGPKNPEWQLEMPVASESRVTLAS